MNPLRHAVACIAVLAALTPAAAEPVAELVGRLDAARLKGGVPAFAVVLVERGRPAVVRYGGVADLADKPPVSDRTRFRIGSITKTFTAVAILLADRAGSLDIEAPLTEATGSGLIANPWAPDDPVTVARLLEHSAGLQDWVRDEWDLNDPLSLADALNYRPASRIVRWRPGLFDSYSNNGPGIAARVLELETGDSYETFVDEHIFTPLGMESATITPDAATFAACGPRRRLRHRRALGHPLLARHLPAVRCHQRGTCRHGAVDPNVPQQRHRQRRPAFDRR
jgi:CubicO group peptidase (beta-lactamase class C family)